MTNKALTHALGMIARFMKEYGMDFERAVDCAVSFTGMSAETLKTAWHLKKEEEK